MIVVALVLVSAAPPAAAEATETAEALAQTRFEAGRTMFDAGDFGGALLGFRSSFELVQSPNTALYIARSLRGLRRFAEAAAQYEEVTRLSREHPQRDRYAEAARAAREEGEALEPRVARLTVTLRGAPPGTRVLLDGRELRAAPRRLPIEVRRAELVVRMPGLAPLRRSLDLVAGKHLELELVIGPPAPAASRPLAPASLTGGHLRRRLQIGGWTTAGTGTATLIAALVLWRVAAARFDTLQARCPGLCPEELRGTQDEGRRLELAANVALGAGLALVIGGGALLLGSRFASKARVSPTTAGFGVLLTWPL